VRSIMKTTGIWWSEQGLVQNRTARFSTDRRRHLMSLITMLGPSPDWCAGQFFARVNYHLFPQRMPLRLCAVKLKLCIRSLPSIKSPATLVDPGSFSKILYH